MKQPLEFYSPLKGISHLPVEGKLAVRQLRESQLLYLERVYDNQYDPHAIAVKDMSQVKVGWIAADMTPQIAPHMDLGTFFTCHVCAIIKPGIVIDLVIKEVIPYALEERTIQEGDLTEHKDRDETRQASEAGHRNSDAEGRKAKAEG